MKQETLELELRAVLRGEASVELATEHAGERHAAPQGVGDDASGQASARHPEEERLRLALEAGSVSAWDWNVVTGAVEWFGSTEGVHGQAPRLFPGSFEGLLDTVHSDDRERLLATIQQSLQTKGNFSVECRQLSAGIEAKWVELKGKAIYDSANQPLRVVGVLTDIAVRTRAEKDLSK